MSVALSDLTPGEHQISARFVLTLGGVSIPRTYSRSLVIDPNFSPRPLPDCTPELQAQLQEMLNPELGDQPYFHAASGLLVSFHTARLPVPVSGRLLARPSGDFKFEEVGTIFWAKSAIGDERPVRIRENAVAESRSTTIPRFRDTPFLDIKIVPDATIDATDPKGTGEFSGCTLEWDNVPNRNPTPATSATGQ
ncbi:MAG TPA: hypothetical protein VMV81_03850 [Phycisphaerae bacterium]|nr:hypothetical protein [Phycisphaerae bacterium]